MSEELDNRARQLAECVPLIAILRGVEPQRAVDVARELIEAGITLVEVPMNSVQPLRSVEAMIAALGDDAMFGAGTVRSVETVDALAQMGADLVVAPDFNARIVERAREHGLLAMPGVLTPTEMFGALAAGAAALKIFPAEIFSPSAVKAVRAVLPREVPMFVVGGVNATNMAEYLRAGATGFGLGSSLFRPGKHIVEIGRDARAVMQAFKAAVSEL